MTLNKRAAIYLRVSTKGQADNGMSLESQKEILIKYVKDNGYTLEEKHIFIDDGVSGIKEDREGLKSLMKSASFREFDVVIVYKIDRFFRKILQLIEYIEYLHKYGITFISTQGKFSLNDTTSKIILPIIGAMAELERDLIRERTMEGKKKKAENGYYVGGGKPPYGYSFNKTSKGVKLIINQEEKEIVNRIFSLYTKDKKTIGEIARILTTDGIKTRDDKILEENLDGIKKGTKKNILGVWHSSSISKILKEEKYIGKYYYGKNKKVVDTITEKIEKTENIESKKEEFIELNCPSILDDFGMFTKAQELLKLNKKIKNNTKSYPLVGLITCGNCGKSYVGYNHSKKGGYSYRCNGKLKYNKYSGLERCDNYEVSGKYLMDTIWDRIYNIFKSPDKEIEKYYNKRKGITDLPKLQKEKEKFEKKLVSKNLEIQEALGRTIQDKKRSDFYFNLVDKFEEEAKNIEDRIKEIEKKIFTLKEFEENKNNLNLLKKFFDKKIQNITEEKKVEIIRELVYKIVIENDGSITITFRFEKKDDDENDKNNLEWTKPKKEETTYLDEIKNDERFFSFKKYKNLTKFIPLPSLKTLKNPYLKGFFIFYSKSC